MPTPPLDADDVEQLGRAYERTRDQTARRASGAFYTPKSLTEPLVRHALEPLVYRGPREGLPRRDWALRSADEILSLRVCDPAAGGGAFLAQACRYLAERLSEASPHRESQARRLVAERCLFGVDNDPLAVEIARASLWRLAGAPGDPASFLSGAIRCGDALTLPWPAAFPGGFDAILCNPPFGNAIRDVPAETKAALRGRFSGLSGTADLAYYFLALAEQIARPDAVTAIILPRAFLTAPAARGLRRRLLASRPPSLIWCPDGGRDFAGANVRIAALVLGGHPLRNAISTDNWWSPLTSPSGLEQTASTVGQCFEVMASMTTAMAYDLLPFLRDEPNGDGLRFVTAGLIDPRSCRWGEKACRYLKRTFAHPRVVVGPGMTPALAKRLVAIRRPKLLVAAAAGPGDRVEAYFDRAGAHCGAVSTLAVLDPDDDLARLEALCERLNGDAVARRLREERGALAMGSGLLTVSKDFVKGLPAVASRATNESEILLPLPREIHKTLMGLSRLPE